MNDVLKPTQSAPLFISTPEYDTFTRQLATLIGGEVGVVERRVFPDGERYQRILADVYERCVILVGGTVSDASTLTLYDLACAVVKYGARRLDLCIPYYGYSTMERAVRSGEVVTAKTRARLLSSVPPSASGNHFHLLDLHSEGIPHYFEGSAMAQHLSARGLWIERLKQINGGDFVLASTDTGRAKHVEALANALNVEVALIIKRRISGSQTEIVGLNAHVNDRVVVIYDDMVRTGGSLIQAARAYREAGAREVYAACSHAVLPEDSWSKLAAEPAIAHVIATDSHPNALRFEPEGLELISVAPLFAQALNPIFSYERA